jgi:hypothetical protein
MPKTTKPEENEVLQAPEHALLPSRLSQDFPHQPSPRWLIAKAVERGDLDMVREFMRLEHEWEAHEARKAFDAAMASAAKEMPIITKTASVNFGYGKASYKHADLSDVVGAVAPILGKHGLYHRFEVQTEPNKITVTCVISHAAGHSIRNSMTAGADTSGSKNAIQAMGSTQTYLSRYTLMASLGLATADDDDGVSHQPPAIKPDVMKGRSPNVGTAKDASIQKEPGGQDQQPGDRGGASGGDTPPDNKPAVLGIKEIQALENQAREAARQGSAVFRTFWLNHNGQQERNVITGLGAELAKLRDEADMALNPKYDAETGEIKE